MLAGGLHSFADERERRRLREEEEERKGVADAITALELEERGVRRGTAPTREVEVRPPELFRGERPGMAGETQPAVPSGFEDARPGLAAPTGVSHVLEALGRAGRPREPQLVVPAGAFVPGAGFAPRHIFDADLKLGLQDQPENFGTREETDPRFRQLTDEFFLDTEATPGSREALAQGEERSRALRAIRALGLTERAGASDPAAILDALEAGIPPGEVFLEQEKAPARATRVVRSGGRNLLVDAETGETIQEFEPDPSRDESERPRGMSQSRWMFLACTATFG